MAKYIASESDISDPSMETETTYVESQDTETSLGSSADKRSRSSILSTVVILLVELCERLTYYTLAGTQKVYLQNQLGRSPSTSAAMNSAFSMLCYFWCIPGGLLADSVGRYKTIVMAGCVYALGAALVALAVIHEVQNTLDWLFMLGCFGLIALGTGGIKPNIANFGADQIGDETEKQRESQKTFFSLFYLSINIGVLIAFGFLTNITTGGLRGLIPMEDGYSFAYGMGAVCMAFAVLLFVAFTRTYTRLPGNGTGAFRQMVWYHWYSVQHGGGWRALISAVGFLCLPLFFVVTLVSALFGGGGEAEEVGGIFDPCAGAKKGESGWRRLHGTSSGNDVLSQIALVLGFMSCVFLIVANVNCSWVKELDDEMKDGKKDGTKIFSVKEAQQTFSAVPVIVVVNIAFNLCYNSMNNAFPSQACQMDLRIGKGQLNGAFFNIADAIAIVVITPILESCIYPMVARMKGSNVRLGQKIIAGLIIACISNLSAAVLEIYRKQAPALCDAGFSQCAPGYDGISGTRMRDISAFWIFIPFALVGIAEVLVNPCMYCFSYEAAPVEVRSLLQAFNLFFQGSVSNAFTASVSKLAYPNNLDEGHLEYYYYVNAALALIGIGMYYAVTRSSGDQEVHATVQE